MASGPLLGEAGDGSREKQRWVESKVYTRKGHNKGSKKSVKPPLSCQSLAQEDVNNSSQQQVSARFDAPSDDSSSLNHRQVAVPESRDPPAENGSVSLDNRVTYNLSSRSKKDLRELRRKLVSELDQVRNLVKKLEAKEIQLNGYSGNGDLRVCANEAVENSVLKRVNSEVASVGHHEPRALAQLSVSVIENRQGGAGDLVEKEKRTPKANQYYHNSGFILGKEKFPPPESNKKSKVNGVKKLGGGGDGGFGFRINKHLSQVYNGCSALLTKLMKHKHGWVFNVPVDVKGLGLYDYHLIIKHPMDLGTVKSRLNSGWYNSPREFAEDVRLTFHNAMTYNPKGQDVHIMAEQLLKIFEDRWAVIESEYNLDFRFEEDRHRASLPTSASTKASTPYLPPETKNNLDRPESISLPVESNLKPSNYALPGRTPAPKKPKAKDPNKRNMTYEEKQKLSTNLQSLPSEKLGNIVQIIKKRNSSLSQHDDEIEVDIDSVDPETLWELDRFVTNYKKSLSKNKRKAELALKAREAVEKNAQEMSRDAAMVNKTMQTKTDEKHMPSSSPVLAEKQGDNESRSSSSSSSSSDSGSSSSDSDSESSSGSEAGHSSRT